MAGLLSLMKGSELLPQQVKKRRRKGMEKRSAIKQIENLIELLRCRHSAARSAPLGPTAFIRHAGPTNFIEILSISVDCLLSSSFTPFSLLPGLHSSIHQLFSLSALALLGGAIGGATAHNPPIELRRRRVDFIDSFQPFFSSSIHKPMKFVGLC